MRSLLTDALHSRNSGRPPVWLMRQAGRYMPQYRKIRANHSFLEMCHNPELAAAVTLLPINAFDMDAAILFSDILVVLEALEVGLHFEEGIGPVIERPLSCAEEIDRLPNPNMAEALSYVGEAIKILKPNLKVPLLGFCGAPFTVASYLIEGKSSRDLKKTKQWMLRDPEGFHRLLSLIARHTIDYLRMQVKAGVSAIQIFDSWAHVLAHEQFKEFSLAYMEQIVNALKSSGVPIILFCRGSSVFAPLLASLSPAGISLDWNSNIATIRSQIPTGITLQGNLDPDILYGPLYLIQKEVKRMLKSMKGDPAYIFNLGHGISPDISMDAVKTLVETVQNA